MQVTSTGFAAGETEYSSGGGVAQISTQNNFAITFTVTDLLAAWGACGE